jgi:transketolase
MQSSEARADARFVEHRCNSLSESVGMALASLASEFEDLVVLDSGTAGESGVQDFRQKYPERYFDFSHQERAMMSAAGGLSAVGLRPVVTASAAQCQRAMEQVRLSLAYPARNVKVVATRPGLEAGAPGGATQVLEDIAQMRAIPGMTIIAPADADEAALAMRAILEIDGPVYLRTGASPVRKIFGAEHRFHLGKGTVLRNGTDVTLVACGPEVALALEAADQLEADGISVCVVNMATIKPLDRELLANCAEVTGAFVTAENHNVSGGLGGAVAEALCASRPCPIECVGTRDVFGTSGQPSVLASHFGITPQEIAEAARRAMKRKNQRPATRDRFSFRSDRKRLLAPL